MQAIINFFKSIWACIVAAIVAILSFFGINTNWIQPPAVTPTSGVTVTAKAPWEKTGITLAEIDALGCELHVGVDIDAYNDVGTNRPYKIDGYRLKDVLEKLGADLGSIKSGSSLYVADTSGAKPYAATIGGELILSDETYIAVFVLDMRPGQANSNPTGTAPRLFTAPSRVNPTKEDPPGSGNKVVVATGTFPDTQYFCSKIDTIKLSYN